MTTETGGNTRPISESTATKVRIVRVKIRWGGEHLLAFIEPIKGNAPQEKITHEYLLRMIGSRFHGKLEIESYAENSQLSAIATAFFMNLRSSFDETQVLKALEQFVMLSGNLVIMPAKSF